MRACATWIGERIEAVEELGAAAARALNSRIRLVRHAQILALPVLYSVMCDRRFRFDVRGGVVLLVLVGMVSLFASAQLAPKFLLRNDSVLIGVAAHVSEVVIGSDLHQHVAVGCHGAAAFPVRIACALHLLGQYDSDGRPRRFITGHNVTRNTRGQWESRNG